MLTDHIIFRRADIIRATKRVSVFIGQELAKAISTDQNPAGPGGQSLGNPPTGLASTKECRPIQVISMAAVSEVAVRGATSDVSAVLIVVFSVHRVSYSGRNRFGGPVFQGCRRTGVTQNEFRLQYDLHRGPARVLQPLKQ